MAVIAVCTFVISIRTRHGSAPIPESSVAAPGRSPVRTRAHPTSDSRTVAVAATAIPGAPKPWWATLSREEVEARREDFEHMRQAPGAWPEFGEIHRQLMDAGVPREIFEMECREIYGALLDRMQAEESEAQFSRPVPDDAPPGEKENCEAVAAHFRRDRLKALAEVHERLASVGIVTDSEATERILQLRPHNPLRPLATDPPPAPLPANLPSSAEVFAAASAAVRAQVEAAIRDGRLPPPTPPEPPNATTEPTKH
jgi:hypothetical protein